MENICAERAHGSPGRDELHERKMRALGNGFICELETISPVIRPHAGDRRLPLASRNCVRRTREYSPRRRSGAAGARRVCEANNLSQRLSRVARVWANVLFALDNIRSSMPSPNDEIRANAENIYSLASASRSPATNRCGGNQIDRVYFCLSTESRLRANMGK